ncbi:lipoprotein [Serinicoccus hydrothermalis]|uniref:Lipoprotein n=1 Tax=Serinicoccus hydrothermalis TaxID=1758689 RepID=A0A1B1NCM1_9MICO|nr:hypothetical protein [Serinicoccus hydrothermalis]ANS79178.1 lipoprotein [Serinicoccus hydrothermalis]
MTGTTTRSLPPVREQARAVRRRHGGYAGLRVAGGVVTAVLVAGAAVGSVPGMLRQSATQLLDLPDDLDRVVVQAPIGDVEVRELRAGERAQVEAQVSWALDQPELELLDGPDDGSVLVQAPCGDNLGQCSADFSLAVPPGTDVEVAGGFGDVDVSTTGAVEASATGGDLTIGGSPERVELDSTMGDVTVESRGETPPELVRVDSTMGDVRVVLPRGFSYAVTTDADLGDAEVTVDRVADSPYVVDVGTTMGDVAVTSAAPSGDG